MSVPLVTLPELEAANRVVQESPFTVRTPLIHHAQNMFPCFPGDVDVYLKLESMQNTGSFKARGVCNQMHHMPEECRSGQRRMVTLSAGNYGKAFSMACGQLGLRGLVVMPDHAPINRKQVIESYGCEVERCLNSILRDRVAEHVTDGMYLSHSYDDHNLIAGYGSIAYEILSEVPPPDVVITCCGGGGMLAGMAAGFKLAGNNQARVYGAEPEGAPTTYLSLKEGHAVTYKQAKSVASGLSPPSAGERTYAHAAKFVDGIALVSEEDIIRNMFRLHRRGLVVEPSGAAAFSAVAEGKVPSRAEGTFEDLRGKKVVIIISGGNVTVEEMYEYSKQFPHLMEK